MTAPNSSSIDSVLALLAKNATAYRDQLLDLLRIPSISARSEHNADTRRAADWLCRRLTQAGLKSEILATAGHPAVFAETPRRPGRPTVLVYGHHDVQPTGDLKLWHSGPFEPVVRDGRIVARGAADDKGQVFTAIAAVEAWMQTAGGPPINVKFLIEGEEEVGSPNLAPLVERERNRLACDYVVIHDTAQFEEGRPAVTIATRGLVYMEIILTGPAKDLHSGLYGGQVANPANVLAGLVASLHDDRARVNIPGFYDDVDPLSDDSRHMMQSLAFDEKAFLADSGSPALCGEDGYSTLERRTVRPTLDVNGIYGGYMGEGSSTIVPSRAGAKISMRLVPRMRADKIEQAFTRTIRERCPDAVRLEIKSHASCDPYVADQNSPGMRAARDAVHAGFGREPLLIREGGTLPILPLFKKILGADSLMMGYCLPTCNAHSPNEFFHVRDFEAGMRSSAIFFGKLAEVR